MVTFTLEKLPDEPILVTQLLPEWRVDPDLMTYTDQITALLDSLTEPVHYIADIRGIQISLGDLLSGANLITRSPSAYLRHANIKSITAVANSRFLDMAIKGLDSGTFGFVSINVFQTLDEALESVRKKTT
jgi:hypothetical protein